MAGPNQKLVIVLEEKRPLRSVEFWAAILGLDGVVALRLGSDDLLPSELLSRSHDCEQQAAASCNSSQFSRSARALERSNVAPEHGILLRNSCENAISWRTVRILLL